MLLMAEKKIAKWRIVWIVVKVVGQAAFKKLRSAAGKSRWLWIGLLLAALIAGYQQLFSWAHHHGAKGGDYLSFAGGATGAALAVLGARWLAKSAEQRQNQLDKSALALNLWLALKAWETVLRRNVNDPPSHLYNETLLRTACGQAAKVLSLIDSDAGVRQSSNIAVGSALFELRQAILRNKKFINRVNKTPFFLDAGKGNIVKKLDRLWFITYDIIRPAYSALDRYVPGTWKSSTIHALHIRYGEALAILLNAEGKRDKNGELYTVDTVFESQTAPTEDEAWEQVQRVVEDWKK